MNFRRHPLAWRFRRLAGSFFPFARFCHATYLDPKSLEASAK
jgi:hypothetical protein